MPGEADELVVLPSERLDRLDHANAAEGESRELSGLHAHAFVQVRPSSADRRDDRRDQRRGDERRERHERAVQDEHASEEDGRDALQEGSRQLPGQPLRDEVVQRDAVSEFARVALLEKGVREPEEVQKERAGLRDGHARLLVPERGGLEPREQEREQRRSRHEQREGAHPFDLFAGDDVVGENLPEGRFEQSRDHEPKSGEQREDHGRPRAGQSREKRLPRASAHAARFEIRSGRERERDARERFVHRSPVDGTGAGRRVVQEIPVVRYALEDEEVVELPEEDDRQRKVVQRFEILLVPRGLHAVGARDLQDVDGAASVAADAALLAELFERDGPSVVAEDDAERRRAAFGRLHLDQRGRADARARWEQGAEERGEGGHGRRPPSSASGRGPSAGKKAPRKGRTSSIGRRR